jgi:two-component sensor histidine kinase
MAFVYGQNEIDSLETISAQQEGSEKIETLIQLHDLSFSDADSTFDYLEEALNIAKKKNDPTLLGNIYQVYAQSLYNLGSISESIPFYQKAYYYRSIYKDTESLRTKSWTLGDIGNAYGDIGNLDSAVYYIELADQVAIDIKDSSQHAILQSNLGYYYYEFGFVEKAFEHHLIGIEIRRQINDPAGLANSLNNLGYLYRMQKQYADAKRYYFEALALNLQANNQVAASQNNHNLGTIYYSEEKLDSALIYFKEALRIRLDEELNLQIISTSNAIATVYMKQGENDLAKQLLDSSLVRSLEFNIVSSEFKTRKKLAEWYFHTGDQASAQLEANLYLDYAETHKIPAQALKAYQLLAKIYKASNQYEKAYESLDQAVKLKDSLDQSSLLSLLEETETKFKNKEIALQNENLKQENVIKELENDELTAESENQKRLLWILIAFLSVTALLLTWVLLSLRRNKKLNAKLEVQKNELNVAVQERDLLLKEIHHRVKNNLQTVSSLLSLQSRYLSDQGAKEAFVQSQNRLDSISILHQHLYQKSDLPIVDLDEYLSSLVKKIETTTVPADKKIGIKGSFIHLRCDIKVAMPLGLIINEVITNSIKHAFNDQTSGNIIVNVKELDEEYCGLVIEDDGSGTDLDLTERRSDSLGLNLIHLLVKQVKGEISITSEKGVKYFIKFKKN